MRRAVLISRQWKGSGASVTSLSMLISTVLRHCVSLVFSLVSLLIPCEQYQRSGFVLSPTIVMHIDFPYMSTLMSKEQRSSSAWRHMAAHRLSYSSVLGH